MRKRLAAILACAAAGGISNLVSMAHAGVFVDNFNTGDVTDGGVFSTGSDTGGTNATVTEAIGGPLYLNYNSATGNDGAYMITAPSQAFNFYSAPALLTLNAAPGGNLIPGTDTSSFNGAFTTLGVDGNGGRIDTGNSRFYVSLSNTNDLEFTMEYVNPSPSNHNVAYNEGIYSGLPSGPNIDVTSMFLYLDGTNEANGQFYIDFGETYTNTTTNVTTTYDEDAHLGLSHYFDIGDGPDGNNNSQANLNDVEAGYPNGAAVGLELQNTTADANGNESVPLGQLIVAVPEPTSFGLIAVGAGMLLRRKSRKA